MDKAFFDDFEVGQRLTSGEYVVDKDELIAFAKKYDPQPFHTDEKAAEGSIYKGLVAASTHTMALSFLLGYQFRPKAVAIATLGWQDVEFPNPVRPGDRLTQMAEVEEKRESTTKPDRGIVRLSVNMTNQRGEPVLLYKMDMLVKKRPRSPEPSPC